MSCIRRTSSTVRKRGSTRSLGQTAEQLVVLVHDLLGERRDPAPPVLRAAGRSDDPPVPLDAEQHVLVFAQGEELHQGLVDDERVAVTVANELLPHVRPLSGATSY